MLPHRSLSGAIYRRIRRAIIDERTCKSRARETFGRVIYYPLPNHDDKSRPVNNLLRDLIARWPLFLPLVNAKAAGEPCQRSRVSVNHRRLHSSCVFPRRGLYNDRVGSLHRPKITCQSTNAFPYDSDHDKTSIVWSDFSNNKGGSWQRGQNSQRSSPSPSRLHHTQEAAAPHTAPVSVSIRIPPEIESFFYCNARDRSVATTSGKPARQSARDSLSIIDCISISRRYLKIRRKRKKKKKEIGERGRGESENGGKKWDAFRCFKHSKISAAAFPSF